MSKFTLEVCADSVESVLAAEKGGADRIELCGNVVIGGTTPSESLFREIRRHSDIKIHALIRPRFGDFCYTEYEFDIIRSEVRRFRELGAQGVVIGMLKPDGSLDVEHLALLMEEAKGMSVTLHRYPHDDFCPCGCGGTFAGAHAVGHQPIYGAAWRTYSGGDSG